MISEVFFWVTLGLLLIMNLIVPNPNKNFLKQYINERKVKANPRGGHFHQAQ